MLVKQENKNDLLIITLENKQGLKVLLTDVGATILSIYLNGKVMTLNPKDYNEVKNPSKYYGKSIGPIGNRVKDGKVEINGKTYQMDINEGKNCLHSGKNGICNQKFAYEINEDKGEVIFKYSKPDLLDGLPGNVNYVIKYTLKDNENLLRIDFDAVSDQDTVLALTNHAYFCLGSKNLSELSLTIPASTFVDPNPTDLLPLGIKDVTASIDFRKAKPILKDINDPYLQNSKTLGYDHDYNFDKLGEAIVLENNNIKLNIVSDFPGVQIYSDNWGKDGDVENTDDLNHRGIAIEPQDSIYKRDITMANNHYTRFIEYSFLNK